MPTLHEIELMCLALLVVPPVVDFLFSVAQSDGTVYRPDPERPIRDSECD